MSRHGAAAEASRLDRRLDALNEARELAAGALPDDVLAGVLQVLDRASSRRSLSGRPYRRRILRGHRQRKVLAASTRSAERKSRRRPRGGPPPPSRWPASGAPRAARQLLDWLAVRNRHHATPVPGFADDGTGLILLDLPDFDSTRAANREIVQRMVGLVDVLVWVLDPQKYADAAVHNDFLARWPHTAPSPWWCSTRSTGSRPLRSRPCWSPSRASWRGTGWARCRSLAPPP